MALCDTISEETAQHILRLDRTDNRYKDTTTVQFVEAVSSLERSVREELLPKGSCTVGEMAQLISGLVFKSDNLSLVPGTHLLQAVMAGVSLPPCAVNK